MTSEEMAYNLVEFEEWTVPNKPTAVGVSGDTVVFHKEDNTYKEASLEDARHILSHLDLKLIFYDAQQTFSEIHPRDPKNWTPDFHCLRKLQEARGLSWRAQRPKTKDELVGRLNILRGMFRNSWSDSTPDQVDKYQLDRVQIYVEAFSKIRSIDPKRFAVNKSMEIMNDGEEEYEKVKALFIVEKIPLAEWEPVEDCMVRAQEELNKNNLAGFLQEHLNWKKEIKVKAMSTNMQGKS